MKKTLQTSNPKLIIFDNCETNGPAFPLIGLKGKVELPLLPEIVTKGKNFPLPPTFGHIAEYGLIIIVH